MSKIRCLIVEDEPIAQEIIESFIGRLPFLTLAGKASNVFEAYDLMAKQSIDLIFCDIEMPQISGLEFLKSLPQRPQVIMTTAFHQYAHEGFELDVTDYLLKPIAFERFLRAIQKVKEKIDARNMLDQQQHSWQTPPPTPPSANVQDHIFVKEDGNLVKVLFDEIFYVEAMKDYVKIYLKDRFIVSYLTMKKMEESLPEDNFQRIHKSYIANLKQIKGISGNMLRLTTDTQIPIGMQYREVLLAKIGHQMVLR
jgi:DNA-binding LytR/AlgR family response regulator